MKPGLETHFFLDCETSPADREAFVDSLSGQVKENESGYAGYSDTKYLKQTLTRQVYGLAASASGSGKPVYDQDKIAQAIERAIFDAGAVLPTANKTHVYVFPTFADFTIEKLNGATGWCDWNNTILLFVYPKAGLEDHVYETVIHEYAHSVTLEKIQGIKDFQWRLVEMLVHEGLAENLVEAVRKQPPFVAGNFSREAATEIHEKVEPKLFGTDFDYSRKVFFGGEGIPVWGGYGLGYWIVKTYIESIPNFKWGDLKAASYQQIYDAYKSA